MRDDLDALRGLVQRGTAVAAVRELLAQGVVRLDDLQEERARVHYTAPEVGQVRMIASGERYRIEAINGASMRVSVLPPSLPVPRLTEAEMVFPLRSIHADPVVWSEAVAGFRVVVAWRSRELDGRLMPATFPDAARERQARHLNAEWLGSAFVGCNRAVCANLLEVPELFPGLHVDWRALVTWDGRRPLDLWFTDGGNPAGHLMVHA